MIFFVLIIKFFVAKPTTNLNGTLLTVAGSGVLQIEDLNSISNQKDTISDIMISNNVLYMDKYIFTDWQSLISANLKSIITIPYPIFANCSKLKNIILGENIQYLSDAFENCPNLETINIPSKLTNIAQPFEFFSLFTKVYISSDHANYLGCDNNNTILTKSGEEILCILSKDETYEIPDSVTILKYNERWKDFTRLTGGSKVVKILNSTFENCTKLQSIELSKSLLEIQPNAFKNCTSLSLNLPQSVKKIGNGAIPLSIIPKLTVDANNEYFAIDKSECFVNRKNNTILGIKSNKNSIELGEFEFIVPGVFQAATSIRTVTINEKMTKIAPYMFYTSNVDTVIIHPKVSEIGEMAFAGTSIKIDLKGGIKKIGFGAFANSSASFDFSTEPLSEISDYAFEGATLKTITFSETIAVIGSFSFFKAKVPTLILKGSPKIGNGAFMESTLNQITLSEKMTSLPPFIFKGCASITEVTIPKAVTEIGESAFEGCSKMNVLSFNGVITKIQKRVFKGTAFGGTLKLKGVTIVEDEAFAECSKITTVSELDSLEKLGNGSFYKTSITSFEMPPKLTEIPERAFAETKISSITFNSVITSIGPSAFLMASFSKLSIPNTVKHLGVSAFEGSALTEITLSTELTEISDSCFKDTGIVSISLHANITRIGNFAFKNSKLKKVTGTNSIVSLGNESFLATQLSSFAFPSTLREIGDSAFKGLSLSAVELPSGLQSIGPSAFEGVKMERIIIPKSVSTIGSRAFFETGYQNVSFLGTAYDIGESAFASSKERSVGVLEISAERIGEKAFDKIAPTNLTLEGVVSIGPMAFSSYKSTSIDLPPTVKFIEKDSFPMAVLNYGPSFNFVEGMIMNLDQTIILTITDEGSITNVPRGVQYIRENQFKGINAEKAEVVLENVCTVGPSAFENSVLRSVVLGPQITHLNESLFAGSTIEYVSIQGELENISETVFARSTISSLTIAKVDRLENLTFTVLKTLRFEFITKSLFIVVESPEVHLYVDYDSLENLGLHNSNIGTLDFGPHVHIIESDFGYNSSIKAIFIDSAEIIQSHSFREIQNKFALTIPKSVSKIYPYSLKISDHIFPVIRVDSENKNFKYEEGCLFDYSKKTLIAFMAADFFIPDVEVIASNAYMEDYSVTEIVLPQVTRRVEYLAFGQMKIDKLTITQSLEEIDVLSENDHLQEFTIGPSLRSVGNIDLTRYDVVDVSKDNPYFVQVENLFLYDSSFTTVFRYEKGATSVSFLPTTREIRPNVFAGDREISSVNLSQIERIGAGAFDGCDALSLGEGALNASYIGKGAFRNTVTRGTIRLGGSLEFLGDESLPPTISVIEYFGVNDTNGNLGYEPNLIRVPKNYPHETFMRLPVEKSLPDYTVEGPEWDGRALTAAEITGIAVGSVLVVIIVVLIVVFVVIRKRLQGNDSVTLTNTITMTTTNTAPPPDQQETVARASAEAEIEVPQKDMSTSSLSVNPRMLTTETTSNEPRRPSTPVETLSVISESTQMAESSSQSDEETSLKSTEISLAAPSSQEVWNTNTVWNSNEQWNPEEWDD